jgi:HemX protein
LIAHERKGEWKMVAERWMYDLLVYIYAISLLFAFADLMQSTPRSLRISYRFLAIVWGLHATIFVLRSCAFFTVTTRFDALFFYAWLLVTVSMVVMHFDPMPLLVFVINLFAFMVLVIALFFASDASPLLERLLLSDFLFVHVTMAMTAYAAFSASSICAALYLLSHYLLKQKRWNRFLMRLPSLDRLQLFARWFVMMGLPLLFLSLILGVIYAYPMWGSSFWWDSKVWGSGGVLGVYAWVWAQGVVSRWRGERLAWWNALSVLALIGNYFLSRFGFSFHHWIW